MVADQGLSQAEQSESSTDSCADSTGHRTRCAPEDFFEGDRAQSPTSPPHGPLPTDHQVREAICRDIWVRLNLRAEVNNPDFMVPECRNQDCTRPEQNCCAWASYCPGFNTIEEFIDDAIQDKAMAAILIPDWPEERWYKTVMAYQKVGGRCWSTPTKSQTGTSMNARKSGTSRQNAGGEGSSSRRSSVVC